MESKIIVIESNTDGAGKQTQTEKLYEYLKKEGRKVKKFTFPNYDSESSLIVRNYLNGKYGEDAGKTDPYIVSTFYAIDRYLTYISDIQKYVEDGYIILFDRYVTSNLIYQTAKIANELEKEKFIDWCEDLEYVKYKLPKPNLVILLDLNLNISKKLREQRKSKTTGRDIHEENSEFLKKVDESAKNLSKSKGWEEIKCDKNGEILAIEEIFDKILKKVNKLLAKNS